MLKDAVPGTKEGKTRLRVMAMAKRPPSDSPSFSAHYLQTPLASGFKPAKQEASSPWPLLPPPNPPAPWPAGWFSPHRETQRQCVPWGCPGSLRPFSSSQTCCVPQGRLLASLSLSVPDGLAQTVLGGYVAHTDGKHAARLSPALVAGSASSGQFPDLPGPPS